MEYILENLEVYNLAEKFSDAIWKLVMGWDSFKKETIGKQLVRSADSISANIAEGYGRYFYKESKQFYFYSRGSILETKSWISKCIRREVVLREEGEPLIEDCNLILKKLNSFIKFISEQQSNKPQTK